MEAQPSGVVPAKTAWMAGPAPLKGMCVILMPVSSFSNSPDKCGVVPMPALE